VTVATRDAETADRGWIRVASNPILIETLLVLTGFGILAVAMTWPLAAEFSTRITGHGSGGDAAGYVWEWWNSADTGLRLWGRDVYENLSAPFGREYPGAINAATLVSIGPATLVSEVASPIAADNVVVLSGVALSGASMYLLVRWLGAGRWVAAWGGLAFSLCPYLVNRVASGHPVLLHLECFPLLIMAGLYWIERPAWRRAALLAAAWLLCWLSNPYFGIVGGLILGCFVVWVVATSLRSDGWRAALRHLGTGAGAAAAIVVVPIYALFLSSRGDVEALFTRQSFELLLYGARLDDYLRPPGDSVVWSWLDPSVAYGAGGERVAYPGAATIVLAVIGIVAAAWAYRSNLAPRMRAAALTVVLIVPVLVLSSLATPQRFFGVEVRLPAELIFEVVPFIRAFARFSSAVAAVLLGAAAVGLYVLVRNRRPVLRAAIVSAAMAFVVLEVPGTLPLPTAEPVTVGGVTPSEVPTWRWLRDRATDEIVFEMPGQPNEPLERFFMIGQTIHGHPMTNGSLILGSLGQDFQKLVGDPRLPNRPEWLAAAGVDLLTVSPWAYQFTEQPPLDPASPLPGFAGEQRFADGSAIWRVTAPPADGIPIFRSTQWWDPEQLPDGRVWRWMSDETRIAVIARASGRHRITFNMAGWGTAPRTLEVTGPDGFTTRLAAGPAERAVSFEMPLAAGRNDIVIRNLGRPAEQISDTDLRIVSVRMSEWEIRRLT
jgi:hypothetical protein